MLKTIEYLEDWLEEVGMDPDLTHCLVEFARGRGSMTIEEVCRGLHPRLQCMAKSQDEIGWIEGIYGTATILFYNLWVAPEHQKMGCQPNYKASWDHAWAVALQECTSA